MSQEGARAEEIRAMISTGVARLAIVVLVAAAAVLLLGCGGDDGGGSEAQPVPGATDFGEGDFDELPRFRGAEPVDDPAVEQDVTSQTFAVQTATPERVMDFFERELQEAGWTVVERPRQIGAQGTYRGIWRTRDQQLVVSATEFSGFDDPSASRTTQYSLSLGPAPSD